MPKKFLIFLIFLGLFVPFFAWAGILSGPIVPCGTKANPTPCTLCDIFKMMQTIITFIGAAIFVIATIFIAVGGVIILASAGSPDKVGQGKAMITSAIIGVIIALLSWVIINEVLIVVSGSTTINGQRVGKIFDWPWNQIQCVGGGITEPEETGNNICCCDLSNPDNPYTCSTYPDNAQCVSDCQTHCQGFTGYLRWCCVDIQRACGGGTNDRCNIMSAPGYCFNNQYSCQRGVIDQISDATPELVNLLNCMAPRLPNYARELSSVSDNSGGRCFSNWNNQCPTGTDSCGGTCCGHGQNSLHYGGAGCRGFSYAVDFAMESACSYIRSAATSCGTSLGLGQVDVVCDPDHVHVELDGLARSRSCI